LRLIALLSKLGRNNISVYSVEGSLSSKLMRNNTCAYLMEPSTR